MNKKGFTLTELLAVIAIISIISLIAVPNIVNITDNIKKDNMLDDAKRFISLAKLEVNSNYGVKNFTDNIKAYEFDIKSLNKNGDFKSEKVNDEIRIIDVDGNYYSNDSYVKYYKEGNTIKYCIYLNGSKRMIGTTSSCVDEKDLTSKDVVHTKNN